MKTAFNTEVGLLAIWNSDAFTGFDTAKKYEDFFTSDPDMLAFMNQGKAIIWSTGGDGAFDITLRINPKEDLSDAEKKLIEMKALNLKLVVNSDKVFIGSPEAVGMEERGLRDGLIKPIDGLSIGSYLVNLYFIYDSAAIELMDKDKAEPTFDKTGQIIVINKVEDNYIFPQISQIPELG